jgi:glycosyltransferase involved in cell wall biosynthesis
VRLLVDAQCVASSSALRGIGRYALSLTRALALTAAEGGHQVEVLLAAGGRQDRLLQARAALEALVGPRAVHVFDAAWPWEHGGPDERRRPPAQAAYAAAVRSIRPDALLVASAFERDDETVLSVGESAADPPTACVLYDLMPALDPGTYLMGPEATTYWRRLDHLRRCDGLLAISEHTARQATTVLGDACPTLSVIRGGPYPSGAFPDFEVVGDDRPGLRLPDPFVLSVGGDHPRKNLDRLVEAWGRVPQHLRRRTPLVVACGLSPGTESRLLRAARRGGVGTGELLLTGRVSERRLQELYARAELFVFASVDEGLGMPPLEAAAAGCPTLLARGSSLSELTPDPEAFFDPLDTPALATAITRVLSQPAARQSLLATSQATAASFTWHDTGRRTWRALAALGPPRGRDWDAVASPVRLSDGPAVERLAAAPAPVLLDVALPAGPPERLGLPVGARAALAPATALLAPTARVASEAVCAGLLDQPVLTDVSQLARSARHDWYAECADGLETLHLDADTAAAVVEAALRSPRWMLERPRPVWLLLTDTEAEVSLDDDLAAAADVDLVVARTAAVSLADLVDVVLTGAAAVPDLEPALARARARGARVVALHECVATAVTPVWCDDVVLPGAPEDAAAWQERLHAAGVEAARTTGWPWRLDG